VDVGDDGIAASRCPTCGDGMRCALPAQARRMERAVRAVLAEERALDRREAKVEAGSGAVAITCPHCAAPLRVTGASSIVTCEYCHASARIPSQTMFKLGHDHPTPKVWWLMFSRAAAPKQRAPKPQLPPRVTPPVESEPTHRP